jgi:hypothetical protein
MILRTVIYSGVLALLMSVPALAKEGDSGNHYGWSKGHHYGRGTGGGGISHSAPGPEIGGGIPALIIGGYLWYRQRRKANLRK